MLQPLLPGGTRYDLQIAAQLDLAQVARSAPLPAGTSLAGRAELDVRARGRTAKPDSVWVQGPILLHAVQVQTPSLLRPVHVEARLQGAGDVVRIETARLTAGTSGLDLTGTLRPSLPPKRARLDFEGDASRLDLVELLPQRRGGSAAPGGRLRRRETHGPPPCCR